MQKYQRVPRTFTTRVDRKEILKWTHRHLKKMGDNLPVEQILDICTIMQDMLQCDNVTYVGQLPFVPRAVSRKRLYLLSEHLTNGIHSSIGISTTVMSLDQDG